MSLQEKPEQANLVSQHPLHNENKNQAPREEALEGNSTIAERLEQLESLPHRNIVLHWGAFCLSLLSLILLLNNSERMNCFQIDRLITILSILNTRQIAHLKWQSLKKEQNIIQKLAIFL